ncbi:MAG TPA: glycerophosphodiester phosphodiesterase [Acidimicrobiales bacterium]|jgi:glycerophosphoryl diester phosphodiesterase|nr:glycerophosphodiester phosphodiesterase [Acidimicrobiales bacterium]
MAAMGVLGHRGSPDPAAGVRENTLESFTRARRLGADGVELDVRSTADGAMAVHHDPVIPGAGTICELPADGLPAFVPLLGTALEACAGMTVNIELKDLPGEPGFDPAERLAVGVADLVRARGRSASVVVSSFWPDALAAVGRAAPEVSTGLLLAGWFDPADAVAAAVRLGCRALHPHVDLVGPGLVDDAHRAGLSVATWTVNDRDRLEGVREAGIDTVITDDVVLALAVRATGRPGV